MNLTHEERLANTAENFAGNRFLVFPLAPGVKVPTDGSNGHLDATDDLDTVRAWWKENPRYNIGLRCGPQPCGINLLVLDVDVKKEKRGRESLLQLQEEYGPLPSTLRTVTATEGNHHYFTYPDGITLGKGEGFRPGLDYRAEDGYVVLPPSRTRDGEYRFEERFHVDRIAPAPAWLISLLLGENGRKTPAEPVGEIIPHGRQHKTLVSLAGTMRHRGMTAAEIFPSLWEVNVNRCERPGSEENIRQIAESVERYSVKEGETASTFTARVLKQMCTPEDVEAYLLADLPPGDGVPGIDAPELDPEILSFTNREGFLKERIEGVRFRTAAEINREGIPETQYLIPYLLPVPALVLVTGIAKGGGKTTFLVYMVRGLNGISKFLGFRCTAPTPVVYLTEQSDKQFFNEYLKPAGIHGSEHLHILHGFEAAALKWKDVVAVAVNRCLDVGGRVLIIDTALYWTRLNGDQENSSGAVQAAVRPLQDAVAAHGLTVILAHHDQKGGASDVYSAGRGSSAWQGVVDLVLNLTRPQGNHRPTIRELRTTGRYAAIPGSLMIELTGEGEYVSHGSEKAVVSKEAREALMEVLPLGEEEALTREKAYEQARLAGAQAADTVLHNELMGLLDKGHVQRIGAGVKGDPYRYFRPLPGD